MTDVIIQKKNEVYLSVDCEPHIKYELSEYFTFEVPNAKFMPQYKRRLWDGTIKLFSPANGEIYVGLYDYLVEWLDTREYTYEDKENKFYGLPKESNELISAPGIVDYVKSLNIPFKVRDYQYTAIYQALKYNRRLLLSPTASGKSLMIYAITRYFADSDRSVLIVVPTTSLVEQLVGDFDSYGWSSDDYCHKIYAGKDKQTNKPVIVTTWQSIYKMPTNWFEQFDAVIGDEAHQFKAKSLIGIMTKLHNCKHRIGFTGTLDGSNTNQLVLEGLFGPVNKVVKTKQLIDKGYLSNLKINILLLQHEESSFESYQEEMDYICRHERRNKFIQNLAINQKGNSLILFAYVEKHGQVLYDMINSKVSDGRKVFFVHGGVETEDREEVRRITEEESDAIIIASYGTFSTGINIRNLHNIIFASPSKSRVRNLQSIGRALRKSESKDSATLYDIADDFTKGERRNYTLNHMVERVKTYSQENFNYEIIPINFRRKNE
jgi:superfamily II DNA or RNA helicase